MIVLITGTPGTGKSTVSKLLNEKLHLENFQSTLVPVNDLIYEKHLYHVPGPGRAFTTAN